MQEMDTVRKQLTTKRAITRLFRGATRLGLGALALGSLVQAFGACGGSSSGNSSGQQPTCSASLPGSLTTKALPSGPGARTLSESGAESTSSVSEAITDGPLTYDPQRTQYRAVVRVETMRNGAVVATATGFAVGRHFVLTAAHTFDAAFGRYDAIRIVTISPQGRDVPVPVVDTLINPFWRPITNGASYPTVQAREDFALLAVPIDFTVIGIQPYTMRRDFLPQHDCNECPISAITAMGWATGALRGVTVVPWDSDSVIRSTGVLEFQQGIQAGDSGGPILFFDGRVGQEYVVGINVARAESTGRSYGSTLSDEVLGNLTVLAARYRADSYGYRYPQPQAELPNGEPNPASSNYPTSVPEAGPSTTTTGSYGYFSIDYPTPTVNPFNDFGDPGGCG